jgi:hypothetical protein
VVVLEVEGLAWEKVCFDEETSNVVLLCFTRHGPGEDDSCNRD